MKKEKEQKKTIVKKNLAAERKQKKATDAEILRRTTEIYQMLLQGYNRFDVIQYCSDEFKIGERQADKYIEKANKKIIELYSDDDKKALLHKHIAMKYELFQALKEESDHLGAARLLESIEKMLNIGAADVNVNINTGIQRAVVIQTRKRDNPFTLPGLNNNNE